jgi:general stress protein 26
MCLINKTGSGGSADAEREERKATGRNAFDCRISHALALRPPARGAAGLELGVSASVCIIMKSEDDGRIWEIVERLGVCMLTTRGPRGLRARPLEARPDRNANTIWFITDVRSRKEEEIAADNAIGLVFIDKENGIYLAIAACAEELCDRDVASSIWRTTDNMWWSGPDDPNVGLLRVTPLRAELWDGPSSKAVMVFEFLKSQITGAKPNLGENRKTTIDME